MWYHLSLKDLGEDVVFLPRIPRRPWMGDGGVPIEDTVTPRTSWASSVERASRGLIGIVRNGTVMYVYRATSLPGEVRPRRAMKDCPQSPGNPYGESFDFRKWQQWAKDAGIPAAERHHSVALKHCVPDAEWTNERWATKPVRAQRVALIEFLDPSGWR